MSEQRFVPAQLRVLSCTVALSIGVASGGCGGGQDAPAPSPPPTGSPAPGPTPSPAPSPAPSPSPSAAPTITQPSDTSVAEGATARFSVTTSPGATLQWQRRDHGAGDWREVAGATTPGYTTPNTFADDDGAQFRVVASNAAGSTTSAAATLDVVPRSWQAKTLVAPAEGGRSNGGSPLQVQFDGRGDAIAVWGDAFYDNGFASTIWTSRYSAGKWSAPSALFDGGFPGAARVSVAADGRAVVAWTQVPYDAGSERGTVWSRRYMPGMGWSAQEQVSPNGALASDVQVDIAADGQLVATWLQWDGVLGSMADVWAASAAPGGNWQAPVLVETQPGQAQSPQVAFDAAGGAILTWRQPLDSGTAYRAWARRFDRIGGWQPAATIDGGDSTTGLGPVRLAASAGGHVFAVWSAREVSDQPLKIAQTFANRYTPAAGWGSAKRIDANAVATYPEDRLAQVAVDAVGRATFLWNEPSGGEAWTARYDGGWGEPERLTKGYAQALAVDPRGNAIVMYSELMDPVPDQIRELRVVRSVLGRWGTPATLETTEGDNSAGGTVAIGADGLGLAVWALLPYRESAEIWAAEFK